MSKSGDSEVECTSVDSMESQLFSVVKQNDRRRLRELILSNRCDPRSIRNEKKETLLHIASKHGLLDIVRSLVEIYQLCPFEVDEFSLTSCHLACQFQHLHVLAYFLKIGGYTYIRDFQPLHLVGPAPLPDNFLLHLLQVATSSRSVLMTRFVYTCLYNTKHMKINLYYDSFNMVTKLFSPKFKFQYDWQYLQFAALCCGDHLDMLKLFLDELVKVSESSMSIHEKSVCSTFLETAYRLDKTDIISYLTKKKGLSPNQDPPFQLTQEYILQPCTHFNCVKQSYSALHAAVQSGNIAIVRKTIRSSSNFYHDATKHLTTDHGTLLHSACVSGNLELVELVLREFQCDIDAQNKHGNTPLHVACEWGWLEIVNFLVVSECNLNVINNYGHTPLTLAIKHSRLEIFKFLFSNNSVNVDVVTADTNESTLHLACCCHHSDFALALLNDPRYTISLDAVDKFGDTPLFNACRLGSIEVVRKLVAQTKCTRLMVNDITKETPAHIACRNDRLDILKVLLTEGVSEPLKASQLNYLGESILHIACYKDSQEINDFLLENEISTFIDSDSSSESFVLSPIHIACSCGNIETVKKLLRSGICKITDKDRNGNTILHYICERQQIDPEMMNILVKDMNADQLLEQRNDSGDSALHLIIKNDGIQVLHTLSKCMSVERLNNALYSVVDNSNNTPLHVAFKQQHSLTLKYLLGSPQFTEGVSKAICIQNTMKDSPLHISCKTEYIELVLTSPHLSSECIGMAVNLRDEEGSNYFHKIMQHPRRYNNNITAVFITFLECVQKTDIMSVLCMRNGCNETPLQCLIKNASCNCDEFVADMLMCLVHSLTNETIKEIICSVTNSDGETLLHKAVNKTLLKAVKVLVEHKMCDPEATNNSGQTSLHYACRLHDDKWGIVYFLCENGCSVHTLDQHGNSPVAFSLMAGYGSLVKGLLSRGYCDLLKAVQSRRVSDQIDSRTRHKYCYVMHPPEDVQSIEFPMLHSMVYNGCNYDVLLPFIAEHEDSLNLCDSFGNTIVHLKSSYHLFLNNLVEFSDCDLNIQNKEGNTPLHIACATESHSMIYKLIESDKCRKSLSLQNKSGQTPIYYISNRKIINDLVMNGADPKDVADSARVKHLTDMFKAVKDKHPLNLTVTALFLGNSLAGKTTLLKSLTKAYSWDHVSQPSIGQVDQKCERTAGIEVSEYSVHKGAQRVLLYDFAGHTEFHSTHSFLVQNRLSSSESSQDSPLLFVIVIDITAPDKLNQLVYWAKFIQNCQLSCITGRKPEIIIIGSHLDKYSGSDDMQKKLKHSLCQTIDKMSDSIDLVENPIFLNCCKPEDNELKKVEKLLIMSTKKLKEHAELDNRCHLIFSYLYDHFPDKPVKFSELQGNLQKRKKYVEIEFQFTTRTLQELLTRLHQMQHILLIGPTIESCDFWILTAKAQNLMFHKVQGLLFAGEDFDMRPSIKSNVGVISSTEIKAMFPDFEYKMLQQFLVYSEFCKKIDDEEVLQLVQRGASNSKREQKMSLSSHHDPNIPDEVSVGTESCDTVDYFFFPGLVKETREKRNLNWKVDDKYSFCSGWSLECTQDNFFNALFLQVLLLRLTFQFAATSLPDSVLHRRCVIWKNGVFWSVPGVEMLVEVTNQNQAVIVLVRCLSDTELKAIRLRSAVLKEVHKVKAKHSPATKAIEIVIYNPSLDENGTLTEPVKKVAMNEIAASISKGEKYVQDNSFQHHLINKDLLCFEPYTGIDSETLMSLFDPDEAGKIVPDNILSSSFNEPEPDALPRQFKEMIRKLNKPISYEHLRNLFDEYSIFHGRNPKVSLESVHI